MARKWKLLQMEWWKFWPISAWPLLALCCSGGLVKIVYAFGYGYGISMAVQGLLAYTAHSDRRDTFVTAAAAYVAYGLRLTWYLRRRQISESWLTSSHGQALEARMTETPLLVKCNVVVFVSAVQQATLYVLDIICNWERPRGWGLPGRRRRIGRLAVRAGLLVALAGLLLEAVADEQKLAAKAMSPELPVTTGLFGIVRHPNYLGEIVFWLGVVAMCAAAPAPALRKAAFLAGGPLFMCWVMVGAARRLDEQALQKYGAVPGFSEYADATPSLLPRLW